MFYIKNEFNCKKIKISNNKDCQKTLMTQKTKNISYQKIHKNSILNKNNNIIL